MAETKKTAKKRTSTNARTSNTARLDPPPVPVDDMAQRVERAKTLLEEKPEVEKRMNPGTMSNLDSDLAIAMDKRVEAKVAASDSKAATSVQNEAAARVAMRLSAIRNAATKDGVKKTVQSAYGVGMQMDARNVTSVKAVATKVLKRVTNEKYRDEAHSLGLLDEDIASLKADVELMVSADADQRVALETKPRTTRERNEAPHRVWAALKHISSRGVLAFPFDPVLRARFDELDNVPPRKKRATGG